MVTSEGSNWWGQTIHKCEDMNYVHTDRLGSVTNLSDEYGRVTARVDYDNWGAVRAYTDITIRQGFRILAPETTFAGHEYDDVLDQYYAKARMYDAEHRRFTSVDPVKGSVASPMTMVQYLYVLDNPQRWVDPLGLCWFDANGNWRHDSWEYVNGYQRIDDPKKSVLMQGSTGEAVKQLQTLLVQYGYLSGASDIDGSFGPNTDAAVREFQKKNGLATDGSVGPKTWEKLSVAKNANKKNDKYLPFREQAAISQLNQQNATSRDYQSMLRQTLTSALQGNNTPEPTRQYMPQVYCPGAEYTTTRAILRKSLTDLLFYQENYQTNPELYHMRANEIRDYLQNYLHENVAADSYAIEYIISDVSIFQVIQARDGSSAADTRNVLEALEFATRDDWAGSAYLMDIELIEAAVGAVSIVELGIPAVEKAISALTPKAAVTITTATTATATATGQWHHILSNKIMAALNSHPTLSGLLDRASSTVQALTLEAHRGYQTWHRVIDSTVVQWLNSNPQATLEEFANELYSLYNTPEMIERFGYSALEWIQGLIK